MVLCKRAAKSYITRRWASLPPRPTIRSSCALLVVHSPQANPALAPAVQIASPSNRAFLCWSFAFSAHRILSPVRALAPKLCPKACPGALIRSRAHPTTHRLPLLSLRARAWPLTDTLNSKPDSTSALLTSIHQLHRADLKTPSAEQVGACWPYCGTRIERAPAVLNPPGFPAILTTYCRRRTIT